MKDWLKLVAILCASGILCSVISHGAIRWFGIRSGHSGYQPYGKEGLKPKAVLYSSSLGYDGIDWQQVSEVLNGTIESWATAGSSPSEWESDDRRSQGVTHAFIAVSPYDLNEYWLCDVRAEVVPLGKTIRDLQASGVDWELCKRTLKQYPQMVVRKLFPTVGRSDGVMVGIRAKLQQITSGSKNPYVDDTPKLGAAGESKVTLKVTDWSPGQLQRRMLLMRESCEGKHSFNGPKAFALRRLLQRATRRGEVTMVVMPVSPFYRKEFLSPSVREEFEEALVKLQTEYPQIRLVRLDRISALDDNNMYGDLVHLNMYGEKIATAAFLDGIKARKVSQ